jgi:hypothetical protein
LRYLNVLKRFEAFFRGEVSIAARTLFRGNFRIRHVGFVTRTLLSGISHFARSQLCHRGTFRINSRFGYETG